MNISSKFQSCQIRDPPKKHLKAFDEQSLLATSFLTPVKIKRGVYNILKMDNLKAQKTLIEKYILHSHGSFTHSYSLIKLDSDYPTLRPVALYETPNRHFKFAKIIDLKLSEDSPVPMEYKVCLYNDSYRSGHIEFCICRDYRYSWRWSELYEGSGEFTYVCWRFRKSDSAEVPCAIIANALFDSPIDDSGLWTIQSDTDLIPEHIALLTGFTVKRLFPVPVTSYYVPPPPVLLKDICFDDDEWVIERSDGKFFADWEQEMSGLDDEDLPPVRTVKVYLLSYLETFAMPQNVLNSLTLRMTLRIQTKLAKLPYQC